MKLGSKDAIKRLNTTALRLLLLSLRTGNLQRYFIPTLSPIAAPMAACLFPLGETEKKCDPPRHLGERHLVERSVAVAALLFMFFFDRGYSSYDCAAPLCLTLPRP